MTVSRPAALITGAAGGLGAGMAHALLDKGWAVIAHVRTAEQGHTLAAAGAEIVTADLSSRSDLSALVAQVKGRVQALSAGGQVVNVASTNQEITDGGDLQLVSGWSRECSYRQSKALLLILTEVVARRWTSRDIRVNAVHPGSRLPAKIVTESGVAPVGSLELGIDTCVKVVTSIAQPTGMLFRAGEGPVPLEALYPDTETNDALVTQLEAYL